MGVATQEPRPIRNHPCLFLVCVSQSLACLRGASGCSLPADRWLGPLTQLRHCCNRLKDQGVRRSRSVMSEAAVSVHMLPPYPFVGEKMTDGDDVNPGTLCCLFRRCAKMVNLRFAFTRRCRSPVTVAAGAPRVTSEEVGREDGAGQRSRARRQPLQPACAVH